MGVGVGITLLAHMLAAILTLALARGAPAPWGNVPNLAELECAIHGFAVEFGSANVGVPSPLRIREFSGVRIHHLADRASPPTRLRPNRALFAPLWGFVHIARASACPVCSGNAPPMQPSHTSCRCTCAPFGTGAPWPGGRISPDNQAATLPLPPPATTGPSGGGCPARRAQPRQLPGAAQQRGSHRPCRENDREGVPGSRTPARSQRPSTSQPPGLTRPPAPRPRRSPRSSAPAPPSAPPPSPL